MQTLANVLNIRIEQMDGMIGPAFGNRPSGGLPLRMFRFPGTDFGGTVKIQNCFEPEPYAVAACEEQYKNISGIQKGGT